MAAYNAANVNNYVDFAWIAAYDPANITVMCRVRPHSVQTTFCSFVSKGSTATAGEWSLGTENANPAARYRWSIRGSDTTLYSAIGGTVVANTFWKHLCGVFDGSNIILYVDGIAVATTACTVSLSAVTQSIRTHIRNNGTAVVDSTVDDIRIFSRALRPSEVLRAFQSPDPRGVGRDSLLIQDLMGPGARDTVRNAGTLFGTLAFESRPPRSPVFISRRPAWNVASSGSTAYAAAINETYTTYSENQTALKRSLAPLAETEFSTYSEALVSTLKAKVLTLADTVALSDSIAVKANFKVLTLSDSIASSESLAAVKHVFSPLAETQFSTFSESLVAKYNAKVTGLADTIAYSEVLTNPSGSVYTVGISEDWVTYSATVSASLGVHAGLSESVALSESLATHANLKTAIAETVALSETIASKWATHQAVSETWTTYSEALSVKLNAKVLALADTVSLSDSLSAKANFKVADAESWTTYQESLAIGPSLGGGNSRMFIVM